MDRRSFLTFLPAAALAPLGALGSSPEDTRHHYHYDHVLGTSVDLVIWSHDTNAAERARDAAVREIQRLNAILNTRDANSEIRRQGEANSSHCSFDLNAVFADYATWERRTGGLISIRPAGRESELNVDALGKAYIINRAAACAWRAASSLDGLLLNIGGDIVTRGKALEIHIADPSTPYDNAPALTAIGLRNAAVATSGTYARGAHLLNARTGRPAEMGTSATVVAPNAVIANALATALCVTDVEEGLRLVDSVPGAEALRISANGSEYRTSGFAWLETPLAKPRLIRTAAVADWPAGFELTLALTLTAGQSAFGGGRGGGFGGGGGRGLPPQFVAVWVESASGKLVRVLAFWANGKAQYYRELSTFFTLMGRDTNAMYSMARATRRPGSYSLVWDGLDEQKKPVPAGSYTIIVETNQEHGTYGKQSGAVVCGDAPAMLMLPKTTNFDAVTIEYGPKKSRA